MQKNNWITPTFLEILEFQESRNVIGQNETGHAWPEPSTKTKSMALKVSNHKKRINFIAPLFLEYWSLILHSGWLRTFLDNILKSRTFVNIYGMGLQQENKLCKNFYLKSFLTNLHLNPKRFYFFCLFQQMWDLTFIDF